MDKFDKLINKVTDFTYVTFLIVMVLVVGFIIYAQFRIIPYVLNSAESYTTAIYIVMPMPVVLFVVGELGVTILSLIFMGIIILSIAKVVKDDYIERDVKNMDIRETKIFHVSMLFFMAFLYSWAYIFLFGRYIDSVSISPGWFRIFQLMMASVWEEIVVRVVFIGIPMILVVKGIPYKYRIKKYLIGGFDFDYRYGYMITVLIITSSMIFALAHVPSWNLWKIPQTFVPSLILGYIFVKYGLHMCILFHLVWNLYPETISYFGSGYGWIILMALLILWLVVGIFNVLDWISYSYNRIVEMVV